MASVTPPALYIEDWAAWWAAVSKQGVLMDLAVLLASALLAWLAVRALGRAAQSRALQAAEEAKARAQAEQEALASRRAEPDAEPEAPETPAVPVAHATALHPPAGASVLFGKRTIDGVLFPLIWLVLAVAGRTALLHWFGPTPLLRVAIPVLVSLLVIRSGVTVLRAAFPGVAVVRLLERTISWVAWVTMVLWVTGVLPRVLAFLDTITWKVGGATISVRTLIEGALTAGALMLLALWIASLVEARLLRSATGTSLSVRKAIANATRAFMLFIGLLMGLSAVGIDLTALSVMGGALGVGIGLGLQKLAANYVSGFVVLAERSVRIGDMVRVGGFEGRISDIRARYTVIRATSGVEAIVPNETLMTSTVENLSFSDRRIHQTTTVSVGYDSDVTQVQQLLVQAARQCPRVLPEPAPVAHLSNFGADGLDFTLGYWIKDPENGLGGPRSEINVAILNALRAHDVDIPYPQRVMHMLPPPPALPAPGAGAPPA
ncbi:MAG: mechanosensitive ion channel [Comamonadaceae bacterium]|nr:mechanosensitive ion channel [Comamonadaceae bacterium]